MATALDDLLLEIDDFESRTLKYIEDSFVLGSPLYLFFDRQESKYLLMTVAKSKKYKISHKDLLFIRIIDISVVYLAESKKEAILYLKTYSGGPPVEFYLDLKKIEKLYGESSADKIAERICVYKDGMFIEYGYYIKGK